MSLLALGAVVLSVSQAQPSTHARVINCGQVLGSATSGPAALDLTCADAGVTLTNLTWNHWGMSVADAHGTLSVNDCSPDCVSGHTTVTKDVAVTLAGLTDDRYTRLVVDHDINGTSGTIYTFPTSLSN